MPRVKNGPQTRERRKWWINRAKGYFGKRKNSYKIARQAVMKALSYAYRDRKKKKGNFRRLWVTRISAACKLNGISYSKFIYGLDKSNIKLDRKVLADIAVREPEVFKDIIDIVKSVNEA